MLPTGLNDAELELKDRNQASTMLEKPEAVQGPSRGTSPEGKLVLELELNPRALSSPLSTPHGLSCWAQFPRPENGQAAVRVALEHAFPTFVDLS